MRFLLGLLREAFRATFAAKARTVLSAVCIGLGIAGVTLVAALGVAAYDKATELMDIYGSDALMVVSGNAKKRAAGQHKVTVTLRDLEGIKQNFPDAYLVAPFRFGPQILASSENGKLTTTVDNVVSSYTEEWSWKVMQGRDLNIQDNEQKRNVCTLGWYLNSILFPDMDGVGQQIRLGRSSCEVVGVHVKKSFGGDDAETNNFVNVPDSVFANKYSWRRDFIIGMRIRFTDPTAIDKYEDQVRNYLRFTHNLSDSDEDDFQIFSSKSFSKIIYTVLGSMAAFLSVITLVVIVVGGFVTANLFMLATQSRINEIGIRRAFGATGKNIFTQFIMEFLLITFCGMLFGLILAYVVALVISSFGFITVSITPVVFGITAVASTVIALVFGILPARAAARISPIEAIRSL